MSSSPRAPAPVTVTPPTEADLGATAERAAEVQAEKAKRKKKAGGTLLTGPEGVKEQGTVKKETLGA